MCIRDRGYTHCQVLYAGSDTNKQAKEVEDVMMDTFVQMTPGVKKEKARKAIAQAADEHLCPALEKSVGKN